MRNGPITAETDCDTVNMLGIKIIQDECFEVGDDFVNDRFVRKNTENNKFQS